MDILITDVKQPIDTKTIALLLEKKIIGSDAYMIRIDDISLAMNHAYFRHGLFSRLTELLLGGKTIDHVVLLHYHKAIDDYLSNIDSYRRKVADLNKFKLLIKSELFIDIDIYMLSHEAEIPKDCMFLLNI